MASQEWLRCVPQRQKYRLCCERAASPSELSSFASRLARVTLSCSSVESRGRAGSRWAYVVGSAASGIKRRRIRKRIGKSSLGKASNSASSAMKSTAFAARGDTRTFAHAMAGEFFIENSFAIGNVGKCESFASAESNASDARPRTHNNLQYRDTVALSYVDIGCCKKCCIRSILKVETRPWDNSSNVVDVSHLSKVPTHSWSCTCGSQWLIDASKWKWRYLALTSSSKARPAVAEVPSTSTLC
mmetsp:Transcript_11653/g.16853  ORF Transcript_11653/g.16853 Transcript_11653/m.16853 type:complete len:244 (+) Transcript_11653:6499-7230(+)